MSRFVLTAQMMVQAPKNLGNVSKQIKSQLANINAPVNVQVNAQSQKALANVNAATKDVAKNAELASSSMYQFGKSVGLAAKRFAAYAIATSVMFKITGAMAEATQAAVKFERELIKVGQVTNSSMASLKGLTDEISRLATGLGVSSQSLVEVSRVLAQAGLSAKDTKIALAALAKTELAPTFENIADTAETAIAVLNQFGMGVGKLEAQLGSINKVAGSFAVEASDLSVVIRRAGGAFKAAGGDLEELIALFTAVRQTTRESAETIATGFRTIFTRMRRPSTIKFLEQIGVSLNDLEGNFVGPFQAVEKLNKALAGLDPRNVRYAAIIEELGGFRQVSKVIPLIQQFAVAQRAYATAQDGANSLTADAQKAQQSLAVQFQKVREEFDALVRKIADSSSFRMMADMAMKMAKSLVRLGEAVAPLLPLLTTMVTMRVGKGIFGMLSGEKGGGIGAAIQGFMDARKTGAGEYNKGGRVLKFARGGVVPGSGNRDTVPAMLQPGEFVIRKSSVDKLGAGNLEKMNRKPQRRNRGGRIQRFNGGGPVVGSEENPQIAMFTGQVGESEKYSENLSNKSYLWSTYSGLTGNYNNDKIQKTIEDKNGKPGALHVDIMRLKRNEEIAADNVNNVSGFIDEQARGMIQKIGKSISGDMYTIKDSAADAALEKSLDISKTRGNILEGAVGALLSEHASQNIGKSDAKFDFTGHQAWPEALMDTLYGQTTNAAYGDVKMAESGIKGNAGMGAIKKNYKSWLDSIQGGSSHPINKMVTLPEEAQAVIDELSEGITDESAIQQRGSQFFAKAREKQGYFEEAIPSQLVNTGGEIQHLQVFKKGGNVSPAMDFYDMMALSGQEFAKPPTTSLAEPGQDIKSIDSAKVIFTKLLKKHGLDADKHLGGLKLDMEADSSNKGQYDYAENAIKLNPKHANEAIMKHELGHAIDRWVQEKQTGPAMTGQVGSTKGLYSSYDQGSDAYRIASEQLTKEKATPGHVMEGSFQFRPDTTASWDTKSGVKFGGRGSTRQEKYYGQSEELFARAMEEGGQNMADMASILTKLNMGGRVTDEQLQQLATDFTSIDVLKAFVEEYSQNRSQEIQKQEEFKKHHSSGAYAKRALTGDGIGKGLAAAGDSIIEGIGTTAIGTFGGAMSGAAIGGALTAPIGGIGAPIGAAIGAGMGLASGALTTVLDTGLQTAYTLGRGILNFMTLGKFSEAAHKRKIAKLGDPYDPPVEEMMPLMTFDMLNKARNEGVSPFQPADTKALREHENRDAILDVLPDDVWTKFGTHAITGKKTDGETIIKEARERILKEIASAEKYAGFSLGPVGGDGGSDVEETRSEKELKKLKDDLKFVNSLKPSEAFYTMEPEWVESTFGSTRTKIGKYEDKATLITDRELHARIKAKEALTEEEKKLENLTKRYRNTTKHKEQVFGRGDGAFDSNYTYDEALNFNKGGSAGPDTVPALLTPGEYVLNKKSAESIGYTKLDRMNKVGKFNKGGPVGTVQRFQGGGTVDQVTETLGDRGVGLGTKLGIAATSAAAFVQTLDGLNEAQQSFAKGVTSAGMAAGVIGQSFTPHIKAFAEKALAAAQEADTLRTALPGMVEELQAIGEAGLALEAELAEAQTAYESASGAVKIYGEDLTRATVAQAEARQAVLENEEAHRKTTAFIAEYAEKHKQAQALLDVASQAQAEQQKVVNRTTNEYMTQVRAMAPFTNALSDAENELSNLEADKITAQFKGEDTTAIDALIAAKKQEVHWAQVSVDVRRGEMDAAKKERDAQQALLDAFKNTTDGLQANADAIEATKDGYIGMAQSLKDSRKTLDENSNAATKEVTAIKDLIDGKKQERDEAKALVDEKQKEVDATTALGNEKYAELEATSNLIAEKEKEANSSAKAAKRMEALKKAGQTAVAAATFLGSMLGDAADKAVAAGEEQVEFFGTTLPTDVAAGISGGVQSAINGAGIGAEIGAMFGPIGSLIGGAIGGVVGAIQGFEAAALAARDGIRKVKIEEAIEAGAKALEDGLKEIAAETKNETKARREAAAASAAMSLATAASAAAAMEDAEERETAVEQVKNEAQAHLQLIDAMAKDARSMADLEASAGTLFSALAAAGVDVGKYKEALRVQIKSQENQRIAQEEYIKSLEQQRQRLNVVVGLANQLKILSQEVKNTAQAFSDAEAFASGGVGKTEVVDMSGVLKDAITFGNTEMFQNEIDNIAASLGPAGKDLADEAKETAAVMAALPEILGNAADEMAGDPTQANFMGSIIEQVEDVLGTSIETSKVGDHIVKTLRAALPEEGDMEKFMQEVNSDPKAAAEKYGKDLVEIFNVLGEASALQTQHLNQLASNLATRTKIEMQITQQRVNINKQIYDNEQRILQLRGMTLNAEKARRTQVSSMVKLLGKEDKILAGSTKKMGQRLKTLQLEVQKRTEALSNAKGAEARMKEVQAIEGLRKRIGGLQAALKEATDVSRQRSAIESQLSKEQEGRKAKQGLLEDFTFGTTEDRQGIQQSSAAAQTLAQTGNISAIPETMRSAAKGFLDRFENVRLGMFGGKTGAEVKAQVEATELAKIMGRPLTGEEMESIFNQTSKEEQLINDLRALNQQQIAAENALVEAQQANSNDLGDIIAKQNADFLKKMEDIMKKSEEGALGAGGSTGPAAPVAAFAEGGNVNKERKTGGIFKSKGTDTVPAMLSPGEFVVNAKAARANKDLLVAINKGANVEPRYLAGGGAVDPRISSLFAKNNPKPVSDWSQEDQDLYKKYKKEWDEKNKKEEAASVGPINLDGIGGMAWKDGFQHNPAIKLERGDVKKGGNLLENSGAAIEEQIASIIQASAVAVSGLQDPSGLSWMYNNEKLFGGRSVKNSPRGISKRVEQAAKAVDSQVASLMGNTAIEESLMALVDAKKDRAFWDNYMKSSMLMFALFPPGRNIAAMVAVGAAAMAQKSDEEIQGMWQPIRAAGAGIGVSVPEQPVTFEDGNNGNLWAVPSITGSAVDTTTMDIGGDMYSAMIESQVDALASQVPLKMGTNIANPSLFMNMFKKGQTGELTGSVNKMIGSANARIKQGINPENILAQFNKGAEDVEALKEQALKFKNAAATILFDKIPQYREMVSESLGEGRQNALAPIFGKDFGSRLIDVNKYLEDSFGTTADDADELLGSISTDLMEKQARKYIKENKNNKQIVGNLAGSSFQPNLAWGNKKFHTQGQYGSTVKAVESTRGRLEGYIEKIGGTTQEGLVNVGSAGKTGSGWSDFFNWFGDAISMPNVLASARQGSNIALSNFDAFLGENDNAWDGTSMVPAYAETGTLVDYLMGKTDNFKSLVAGVAKGLPDEFKSGGAGSKKFVEDMKGMLGKYEGWAKTGQGIKTFGQISQLYAEKGGFNIRMQDPQNPTDATATINAEQLIGGEEAAKAHETAEQKAKEAADAAAAEAAAIAGGAQADAEGVAQIGAQNREKQALPPEIEQFKAIMFNRIRNGYNKTTPRDFMSFGMRMPQSTNDIEGKLPHVTGVIKELDALVKEGYLVGENEGMQFDSQNFVRAAGAQMKTKDGEGGAEAEDHIDRGQMAASINANVNRINALVARWFDSVKTETIGRQGLQRLFPEYEAMYPHFERAAKENIKNLQDPEQLKAWGLNDEEAKNVAKNAAVEAEALPGVIDAGREADTVLAWLGISKKQWNRMTPQQRAAASAQFKALKNRNKREAAQTAKQPLGGQVEFGAAAGGENQLVMGQPDELAAWPKTYGGMTIDSLAQFMTLMETFRQAGSYENLAAANKKAYDAMKDDPWARERIPFSVAASVVPDISTFATGGIVSGRGGIDNVPAMLTAGEYVIKKSAVNKYGAGFFEALNGAGQVSLQGGVGHYNNGGMVQDFTPMLNEFLAAWTSANQSLISEISAAMNNNASGSGNGGASPEIASLSAALNNVVSPFNDLTAAMNKFTSGEAVIHIEMPTGIQVDITAPDILTQLGGHIQEMIMQKVVFAINNNIEHGSNGGHKYKG